MVLWILSSWLAEEEILNLSPSIGGTNSRSDRIYLASNLPFDLSTEKPRTSIQLTKCDG